MSDIGDSAIDFLFGRELGAGVHRRVYELVGQPDVVIKVARSGMGVEGIQANIAEWELSQWVEEGKCYAYAKKWIAPCVRISDDGRLLIQKRTYPVRQEELPKRVPDWITDVKRGNAGMFEGRVVFHDYAYHIALDDGLISKKTKKANWRDY